MTKITKKRKLRHVNRRLTEEDRNRHARIREAALKDIPPKGTSRRVPSPPGISAQIRAAREARGLTWYALSKLAGIPNQATVRDVERGKDIKLSSLLAIANALGVKLELVEKRR